MNLGYLTAINHEVDSTESTVQIFFKIIGEGECRGGTTIFIKKLEDEKSLYKL